MTSQEAAEINLLVAKAEGIYAVIQTGGDTDPIDPIVWRADVGLCYDPLTDGNLIVALMHKYKISLDWPTGLSYCMALHHNIDSSRLPAHITTQGITIGECVCRCVLAIHSQPEGGR